MEANAAQHATWIRYAITGAIILAVFAFRARGVAKLRPLNPQMLWVVPAIYAVIVIANFVLRPPRATGWAISIAALLIGAALGWQRGRFTRIHVDPETHTVQQSTSIASLALIAVLVAMKQAANAGGSVAHLDMATITDALLAFALGTFAAMRIEMYLRASRLLASVRAAR